MVTKTPSEIDDSEEFFLKDDLEKYVRDKFRKIDDRQFDFIVENPSCVYTLKSMYAGEFYEGKAKEFHGVIKALLDNS